MGYEKYFDVIKQMIKEIEMNEEKNIKKAAELVADSIMSGGIIQATGNGHSFIAALEICGRAGGLIPTKPLNSPVFNPYENLEGVGLKFMENTDIQPHDVFVINSNSGRNPLSIEIAQCIKAKGNKVIAITSYEASKSLTSRHSSGKMLYDYADVILDTKGVYGDAAIELDGMKTKVAATSAVTAALMANCMILEAVEIMLEKGYEPPVYKSNNIDGGLEHNQKLIKQYAHRIFRSRKIV